MIYGIGTDIVQINRIEESLQKFGEKFEERNFAGHEQDKANSLKNNKAAFYAKRFAAKEAFVKALGSGFTGGLSLKDISVVNDDAGKPEIQLENYAKEYVAKIANGSKIKIHLSLSDDYPVANALVVIEII